MNYYQTEAASGRFMDKPDTEYTRLLQELRQFGQSQGLDDLGRLTAEATWKSKRDATLRMFKAKFCGGRSCLHRLLGRRCSYNLDCRAPGSDHEVLLKNENGSFAYLSQPYDLSLDDCEGLVALCRRENLTFWINGNTSFHFPGRTFSVYLERKKR